jgi:hypothetical protein
MSVKNISDALKPVTKPDSEIDKLRLADVKTYAKEISAASRALFELLFDAKDGIIPRLESQLAVSQKVNERLLDHLNQVEKRSVGNAQYARRETLELHGVPPSFDNGEGLEANVVKLLQDVAPDANVDADSFHAVHRLKKPQNVIIKFVSRKKSLAVIRKRAALKNAELKNKHGLGNIWLNESMCYEMSQLFWQCKKLKDKGTIAYYTFFNGSLRIKVEEGGDKVTIGHITDLMDHTGLSKTEILNICK